jgi:hypothetical protein
VKGVDCKAAPGQKQHDPARQMSGCAKAPEPNKFERRFHV